LTLFKEQTNWDKLDNRRWSSQLYGNAGSLINWSPGTSQYTDHTHTIEFACNQRA